MVKLIHNYIFSAVLFSSLGAVGLFVFVLLTGNVLKDILGLFASGQLTGDMFLKLLWHLIPYVVSYALPLGILTGILIVLGRLSSQSEIIALKSVGLSLWRITAPIFVLSFFGVMLAVALNAYFSPNAKASYRYLLASAVRENPVRFMVPRVFIHEFPGYVLYVGRKNGRELEDFWIWELDSRQRAIKLLRASSGAFSYEEGSTELILTLKEGFSELRSETAPDDLKSIRPAVAFRQTRIRLPLDELWGKSKSRQSLSAMNFRLLLDRKNELTEILNTLPPEASAEERSGLEKDKMAVQIKLHKAFAMGFSVLSLTLVGMPLGIIVRRKETYANAALALFLALGYHFLMIVVGWLEKQPDLRPDLLMWAPNFIFQAVGLYLMYRANKH